MLSVEQGLNIYHLLSQTLGRNVPGAVIECGCFRGVTSALMRAVLDQHGSDKELHLYDSFEGLPCPSLEDAAVSVHAGSFKTDPVRVYETFTQFGLTLPKIHKGWFHESLPVMLPDQVSFAHLDGDLYESTRDCLQFVYPKLAAGACVVIDDYCDPDQHTEANREYAQNLVAAHSATALERANAKNPNLYPGVKRACDEFFADKPEKMVPLFGGFSPHGYFIKSEL